MIATFDAVSDLLAEAGAVLDVDGIAAYEEERSWIVAVAEEGNEAITIDYEEDFAKLFITAALGTPPAAKRAATHTFMLEYNAMWTDTGGVRLGLSPESGDILLIHDLPLAGLTPEILHRTLSTFIVLSRSLRAVVVEGLEDDSDVHAPEIDPSMDPGMLPV